MALTPYERVHIDGSLARIQFSVCPLQLDLIRRCIRLYSNPGDLVVDPFGGIGSVLCVAIEQGRRGVQFELKQSYHRLALKNVEWVRRKLQEEQMLPLFDSVDIGEEADA